MLGFIWQRVLHAVLVIFFVVVLVFLATHVLGDPARLMLPDSASNSEVIALQHHIGVDRPLYVQFFSYLGNVFRGNFGISLWQDVPVMPIVMNSLRYTLVLAAVTLGIAVPLAVLLGSIAGVRPGSHVDRGIVGLSIVGISLVNFWAGLLLILVFAVHLGWLPASGAGGIQYVILPACALMLQPFGRLTQITRGTASEEVVKTYVTAVEAKGMSRRRVTFGHILRNVALPVITLAGTEFLSLISATVVVETVFSWPGIGRLLIQSIQHRDLPLIEATVFVITVFVVVVNLAVDIACIYLNPLARVG